MSKAADRLKYSASEWPIASIGAMAFILSIPLGLISMGFETAAKAIAANVITTIITVVLAYVLVFFVPVVYRFIKLDFFVALLYVFMITYAYFAMRSFLFEAISMPVAMDGQISFFAFLLICVGFTFPLEVLFGGIENKIKIIENSDEARCASA